MKALFFGLGSIGQRHLRNLINIFPEVKLSAYRTSKKVPLLSGDNVPISNIDLKDHYKIEEFTSLEKAFQNMPDIVFITNPSKYHCKYAYEAIKAGSYVFIEKPLSTDIESAQEIINLEKKINKKRCMVGFQYRYNPALIKMKELIDKNIIGKIVNGQISNGEYLPNWHPYENYRDSYASKKSLGGGACLTQIHDFDYSIYLFGMPTKVYAVGGKLSSLEIDVEDSVQVLASFNHQKEIIPINISLDYLSWPSRRYINLFGEKGTIKCDLNNNIITLNERELNKKSEYNFSSINRNEIFVYELKNFLSFAKGLENPKVDLEEGIKSLKFALAVKKSITDKLPIEI